MGLFDVLGSLVGSVSTEAPLAGGLFGLAGSIAGRVVGIFEAKQKRIDRAMEIAHEKDEWGQELKLQELQQAAKREETEDELKILAAAREEIAATGSWSGLEASIANQTAMVGKSYRWADAVNQLARAALTLLLVIGLIVIFLATQNDDNEAMAQTVVDAIVFAAITAFVWWFGDRFSGWPKGGR